jgi:phosphoglycerol transferase MdoB-like AlkP superfamily enzyme
MHPRGWRPAVGSALRWRRAADLLRCGGSILVTLLLSFLLVFLIELIARRSAADAWHFITASAGPGAATVFVGACALLAFDAALGRCHSALVLFTPPALTCAWISWQKVWYLGDPLYPADFLYARQILELAPMLMREQPLLAPTAALAIASILAVVAGAVKFHKSLFSPVSLPGRCLRLAFAAPALAGFATAMDPTSFSWTRDRLGIVPKVWDQKANYAHNGFFLGFALNLPMARIAAPAGYSGAAIDAIPTSRPAVVSRPKADIIVVMNESFWDPTRLPGVTFDTDPIPTVRAAQSGHIFSPEFGGMTSNVEFEALTGFSNAFLPYGSVPYQQYVRQRMPSLASFLKDEGYRTLAVHPFREWFWNRGDVYAAFGFDSFLSEERLPRLNKRGPLASDAALTEEIIRRAETTDSPLFLFAVTLQNHGPYEPRRYSDPGVAVTTRIDPKSTAAVVSFAEGAADADRSLARLLDWARHRKRHTVIVFFGDHLPPLGEAYVTTGFMDRPVGARSGPIEQMKRQRETPLVIWSNRSGARQGIGTISPSLLPLYILEMAGMSHPYYTGFLGMIRDRYQVVDRHVLLGRFRRAVQDWPRAAELDPLIRDYRLLQYDIMFGERHGAARFFPGRQEAVVPFASKAMNGRRTGFASRAGRSPDG